MSHISSIQYSRHIHIKIKSDQCADRTKLADSALYNLIIYVADGATANSLFKKHEVLPTGCFHFDFESLSRAFVSSDRRLQLQVK